MTKTKSLNDIRPEGFGDDYFAQINSHARENAY